MTCPTCGHELTDRAAQQWSTIVIPAPPPVLFCPACNVSYRKVRLYPAFGKDKRPCVLKLVPVEDWK